MQGFPLAVFPPHHSEKFLGVFVFQRGVRGLHCTQEQADPSCAYLGMSLSYTAVKAEAATNMHGVFRGQDTRAGVWSL